MNKQVSTVINKFINFNYGDKPCKRGNDSIVQQDKNIVWLYHDNIIASANLEERKLLLSLAGFPTKSTMERLNMLLQEMGVRGYPFRGYGTTRYPPHPVFCGNPIDWRDNILIDVNAIKAGVYND